MIMVGHNVCNALHPGYTVMNVTDIVPPCSSLYRRTEIEASNLCFKNALQAILTTGQFRRTMFQTKCKQVTFQPELPEYGYIFDRASDLSSHNYLGIYTPF